MTEKDETGIYFLDHQIMSLGEIPEAGEADSRLITELLDPGKKVLLLIDSIGGNCQIGYSLANAIQAHGNVTGLVVRVCKSMANVVLQSCQTRLAVPQATFLFHSLADRLEIKFIDLMDDDWVREKQKEAQTHQQRYYHYITGRSENISIDDVRQWCKEEMEFSAHKAWKLGLIDGIAVEATLGISRPNN